MVLAACLAATPAALMTATDADMKAYDRKFGRDHPKLYVLATAHDFALIFIFPLRNLFPPDAKRKYAVLLFRYFSFASFAEETRLSAHHVRAICCDRWPFWIAKTVDRLVGAKPTRALNSLS